MKRYLNVNLKPMLVKLELASRKTTSPSGIVGKYKSFYKGAGLEFEGYREYTPADDASKIDWKASLRSNQTIIKEYAQAKNLLLYMMVDCSDSMVSGTEEKLKNEYAAELSAFIAYNILVNDDNLGYAMYSDGAIKYKLPKRGSRQFYSMQKNLMDPDNYGGPSDLTKTLNFVMTFLQRGSFLIIISDFLHMSPEDLRYLKIASSKYEIICFIIRDKVDYRLPENMEVLVEDPITKKSKRISTNKISKEYEQNARSMLESLKKEMTISNIDFLELNPAKPYLHDVLKFIHKRQMKWK